MSNSSELHSYIARLQRRLRLGAGLRGAAIFTSAALLATLGLVWLLNRLAFPAPGVTGARLGLIAVLAAVATFGTALPLMRLTRARSVRRAESANPELEQRLTTFEERASSGNDPFLELLAADTLARTTNSAPSELVPAKHLLALGGAGFACLAVLVWMIFAGPGYVGYGASLLWTGTRKNIAPLYGITVKPGNLTVRRNSDQLITAQVSGMAPGRAQLFARFKSSTGWEPVTMQAAPDAGGGATYRFVFAGLPESVEYYITAGPLVSPHYKLHVIDLPSVKQVSVTYHYPAWTGMKSMTEEHSGDLRAIEGTDAAITIQMDRPLAGGRLTLDSGQSLQLTGGKNNVYHASIHMEKDGAYHVAATDDGQPVRLSEDYFIATDKALPPQVSIDRPGGDYRASPIEEVTVGVNAADQFSLHDMDLHYSVNGGPDQKVSLLKTPGAKTADGKYLLSLEDFKLAPGDLVSIYATARDGHSTGRTDISFIQVDPFEREFSQSQQMAGGGGGGGGGGDQTEISRREKELIAATWKQENDKTATAKDAAAQGQFLSDAQQKLRDQVTALSIRMQSRDISSAHGEFGDFNKDMQIAAAAMTPSAEKLKSMKWKDAIPLEQKALQALLHAEATFRQIEVAFGQRGGGGGGGGNTGRDLASLFDLELDMEKNQYETARTASPQEQHEKDVEDALEKLDALAKRQEDLANQQQNPQQNFQQRWQQEMLRREAEQLQRQMEQLARNGQQGANASAPGQQSQQQSSSTQNGSQGQSGSPSSQAQNGGQPGASSSGQSADQNVEQALSRLRQATGEMQRAGSPEQQAEAARQAAERLREATNMLAGSQHQLATNSLTSMAQDAEHLAQQERAQAQSINQLAAQQNDSGSANGNFSSSYLDSMMARIHQRDQLAQQRQQLSNGLSRLQQKMRDAARMVAPNQPDVAGKLRDALTEMDQSDLDNHVQRTADWLRSGINPNSNGTESEIAQGLQHLSRRLQDAEQAMSREKPSQPGATSGDQTQALDQVERLRSWIEGMGQQQNGSKQSGQNGQNQAQQNAPRGSQPGANGNQPGGFNPQLSRNSGQGDQAGALSRYGAARGPQRGGAYRNGDVGGPVGDTRYGRGGAGTVYGNVNTGNNSYGRGRQQQTAPTNSYGNPGDTERTFEQNMSGLTELRQMVQSDPQTAKDVAELTRLMQHLDPHRFPGNPAEVQRMHQELLSTVGRLELQLQRDGISSDARTGKPPAVPAGYRDAVAEYYKKLSKNP
ncbi:MAG TPA: hypothetical protein VGR47_17825 [Terracidiphilus sp.]|nr:hypothetical protein [Terracidiphilus sp.]